MPKVLTKVKLQYDLVLKASVEVFVGQDDRVEYDDLRGDVYITAWEKNHIRWIAFIYIIHSWWRPTQLPRIVMEGVSFPSLKSVSLSILAYGSLGLGSLGVPSTLAHFPMVLSQPTMLFSTQLWSYSTHRQVIYCILRCESLGLNGRQKATWK